MHFDEHDYFYFYFQVDVEKLPHFEIHNGEPEKIEEFKWFSIQAAKKISEFNKVGSRKLSNGNPFSEFGWPLTLKMFLGLSLTKDDGLPR